jgi:DNA replication protein DnaC
LIGETFIPGPPCENCGKPTEMRTVFVPDDSPSPQESKGFGTLLGPGASLTMRVYSCGHAYTATDEGLHQTTVAEAERLYNLNRSGGLQVPAGWRRISRLDLDWTAPDQAKHKTVLELYLGTLADRIKAGEGLTLYGAPGTGKTMLTSLVLTEAERMGVAGALERVTDLIGNWWKSGDGNDYRKHLARVPLLVIDDVGTETPNGGAVEAIFGAVDARYAERRPTFITTNLAGNEMAARYVDKQGTAWLKLLERLNERNHVLTFSGPSYRGNLRANWWRAAKQAAAAEASIPDWKDETA